MEKNQGDTALFADRIFKPKSQRIIPQNIEAKDFFLKTHYRSLMPERLKRLRSNIFFPFEQTLKKKLFADFVASILSRMNFQKFSE